MEVAACARSEGVSCNMQKNCPRDYGFPRANFRLPTKGGRKEDGAAVREEGSDGGLESGHEVTRLCPNEGRPYTGLVFVLVMQAGHDFRLWRHRIRSVDLRKNLRVQ